MAFSLFSAKPLSEPVLGYCQLDPQEQTSVKCNRNTKLLIRKNASENIVCEKTAILSRGRWVKDEFYVFINFLYVLLVPFHTDNCAVVH